MFARALIAFLALPGTVAGVIPALIAALDRGRNGGTPSGFIVLGFGVIGLLWCVRDFFVSGKGTLAPWDPPKHLVVVGLYRFVRNPMYLCVLTVLVGWWLGTGSRSLAIYAGVLAIGFHLRVLIHEEPWLRRQFGEEWTAYSASVRRWLPRLTPWKQSKRS